MKTWDDWSDKEIDSSVASIVFDCKGWSKTKSFYGLYIELNEGKEIKVQSVPNYCNNWADIGPIIASNGISLVWIGGVDDAWKARSVHTNSFVSANPLRAAAIVFLMMNGVKP